MMELSFKLATYGSIALDAMVEEKKYSYLLLTTFSQPQSPSTAVTKTSRFSQLFDVPRPKEEEGGILETRHE